MGLRNAVVEGVAIEMIDKVTCFYTTIVLGVTVLKGLEPLAIRDVTGWICPVVATSAGTWFVRTNLGNRVAVCKGV